MARFLDVSGTALAAGSLEFLPIRRREAIKTKHHRSPALPVGEPPTLPEGGWQERFSIAPATS